SVCLCVCVCVCVCACVCLCVCICVCARCVELLRNKQSTVYHSINSLCSDRLFVSLVIDCVCLCVCVCVCVCVCGSLFVHIKCVQRGSHTHTQTTQPPTHTSTTLARCTHV